MAEIILAAIDQKRGAREQAETKLSFFKTPLTYRWLTRFRSMLSSASPSARAEKRKWLRQYPAASNVGSSAPSFKMIGILREKKHLCLK